MSEISVTIVFLLGASIFIVGFLFGALTGYGRTSALRRKLMHSKEEIYNLKKVQQKQAQTLSESVDGTAHKDSFDFELQVARKENQLVELRKEVEELRAKFSKKESDFQIIAAQTAGLAPLSNRLHENNAKMGAMESDLRELDLARAQAETLLEQLLDAEKQFETTLNHKQIQIESLEKSLQAAEKRLGQLRVEN